MAKPAEQSAFGTWQSDRTESGKPLPRD